MARRTRIGSTKTRSTARLGAPSLRSDAGIAATAERNVGQAKRSRVNWSRVMAAFLVLGSLGLIYQLFAAPRFVTRHVVVIGNKLLSQSDIEQASQALGRSIFHANPTQIAAQLMSQYGCLADVTVQTRLPNQVRVETVEHQDLIIWQSGGSNWWVTREGQCLGPAHCADGLPVIRDVYAHNAEPRGYIVGVPWELLDAIIADQPSTEGFDYTREHGVITYVGQARCPVFLGHRGDAHLKLAIMSSLYDHLSEQGISADYIDLRNEREPTFKPR